MDYGRLKELANADVSALRDAVRGMLRQVWTTLPVIVAEDSDGHVMKANSAVRMTVTAIDGTRSTQDFAPFDTSPVHYPQGGDVIATHPVKKDDEGIILFTALAQDVWHQKGGVQDPIDARRHHLSDSRYLAGGRSDPRKLNPPPSSVAWQSRSVAGDHLREVHPKNGLASVSTARHVVVITGGSSGAAAFDAGSSDGTSGTLHIPGKVLANAGKYLINCIKQTPLPDPGASYANKKAIALLPVGAMSGGSSGSGIASIMSAVMSGGAGAIFANPIAGQSGGLASAITAALGTAGGGPGGSALVSALNGMQSALGGLTSGASALSGATIPGTGEMGLDSLLNHAQSLSQFWGGSPPPDSVKLGVAGGPVMSGPTLDQMTVDLNALMADVNAGTADKYAAADAVNAWAAQLAAVVPASTAAITTLAGQAPLLNLALEAANAGVSLDPNENAVHGAITNPNLDALTQHMAAIFTLTPAEAASASSFPDRTAAQPGATGGL